MSGQQHKFYLPHFPEGRGQLYTGYISSVNKLVPLWTLPTYTNLLIVISRCMTLFIFGTGSFRLKVEITEVDIYWPYHAVLRSTRAIRH